MYVSKAMEKEVYSAIKTDFLQVRREGDDTNIIFSQKQLGYLGVAIEYSL
jgi:hypothetical protein